MSFAISKQAECLSCLLCSDTSLAIEVVIPTEESLSMKESIILPETSSSVFGHMTPTFQMPSAVILNQINKEGTA